MKLYRFSPIKNQKELYEAIYYIHQKSYELCHRSFGGYFSNAGNMGIFCHYDDEFDALVGIRRELTEPSEDPNQKYFTLYDPITVVEKDGIPGAVYTHLYIRKPDIYRSQVGDIDFYVDVDTYNELKNKLLSGQKIPGARLFPRNDLDMIELYDPDVDVLAYVSPQAMTEKVRIKLSEETNL